LCRGFGESNTVSEQGVNMSENGLQKTAFFMLVALIFYVSVMGGA
jgi:hypothetical protein